MLQYQRADSDCFDGSEGETDTAMSKKARKQAVKMAKRGLESYVCPSGGSARDHSCGAGRSCTCEGGHQVSLGRCLGSSHIENRKARCDRLVGYSMLSCDLLKPVYELFTTEMFFAPEAVPQADHVQHPS